MSEYPVGEGLTDALFDKICKYVYEHARIHLTEKKRELVRARLGKVIREQGFKGYRHFYQYMLDDTSGDALREVMNAVSTNLTSFYREDQHFKYLAKSLLPELVQRRSAERRPSLRGWSAGCSTGEEVYTIAITINEAIPGIASWDARLLASDIDTNVVATGQRGIYDKKRVESVPGGLLNKYFTRLDGEQKGRFEVSPQLKRLIAFRFLNLMQAWPFRRPFDFIFCRNVMIYFDQPTQEALVNRFYDALAPGGHLFIGHSEGLSGVKHAFSYVQPTIYRK